MSDGDMFVFLGVYATEEDAHADHDVLKRLHDEGALGRCDAAVISHADDGSVQVTRDSHHLRKGAWAGAAVGAVAGILFPPSVLVSGALGAGAGAVVGRFRRGLSQADADELGGLVGAGETGLVVAAEQAAAPVLERELTRARTTVQKGLTAPTPS
jgi:uncharacterized membrane protein